MRPRLLATRYKNFVSHRKFKTNNLKQEITTLIFFLEINLRFIERDQCWISRISDFITILTIFMRMF